MNNFKFWIRFIGITLGLLLITGIPTDIIPNSIFARMTPIFWWGYVFWILIAILSGFYIVHTWTYPKKCKRDGLATVGLFGGLFAIACPICISFLVALFGVSAIMTYFAPFQPILGILTTGLLAFLCFQRIKK